MGQILTLYSFKGGVGRSMAAANLAFYAAMNGHKVLVMDWDLEAPGLDYYFRGMIPPEDVKSVKSIPGILDIVWEWANSIHSSRSAADVTALMERYAVGVPFVKAARTLIDERLLPEGAKLDFISAGRPTILTPDETPYGDALASFSWKAFFEEKVGGVLIQSLRTWASQNYDLVLIDSRTGLADVAGVCTMQIPDAVALCFVFNRQNIDGVANVAAAIRRRRGEEIQLRAVPMRISRENTPEEIDARARARRELISIGGFSGEQIDLDFKNLTIRAAPNVPFYETLAAIASYGERHDPFALNYLSFSSELMGFDLQAPILDPGWVETVKRRLQPKFATVDYIVNLRSADPDRALDELAHLIEAAYEGAISEDELVEKDYAHALLETALELSPTGDSFDGVHVLGRAVDLIRALSARNPNEWRPHLIRGLESYLEQAFFIDDEEELALLDELDALLSFSKTSNSILRRIEHRRRAARISIATEPESALQYIGQISALIADAQSQSKLSAEHLAQVFAAEIDVYLLRGLVFENTNQPAKAKREFEKALNGASSRGASSAPNPEFVRLEYDALSRLARLPPPSMSAKEAALHAVAASRFSGQVNLFNYQFVDLANVVVTQRDPELAIEFIKNAFGESVERRSKQFASFYARPRSITSFISVLGELTDLVSTSNSAGREEVIQTITEAGVATAQFYLGRSFSTTRRSRADFYSTLVSLRGVLESAGADISEFDNIMDKANRWRSVERAVPKE